MRPTNSFLSTIVAMCFISVLTVAPIPAGATTHVIQFGAGAGLKYVPATVSAKVGDTIMWEGSFSAHPLSSTTIPANALPWHNSAGSIFRYVITVTGTYDYVCDVHVSAGMTGSFTAGTTGAAYRPPKKNVGPILFTALMTSRCVQVSVPNAGLIGARTIGLDGRQHVRSTVQATREGSFSLPRAALPAHGVYYVEIMFDGKRVAPVFVRAR